MVTSPCDMLLDAIETILLAATELPEVASRITRQPEEGISFPYVLIGEATSSDIPVDGMAPIDVTFTIHVFSRKGRPAAAREAARLNETISNVLLSSSIDITPHEITDIQRKTSVSSLEDDGVTSQSITLWVVQIDTKGD